MKFNSFALTVLLMIFAESALAQTKISSKAKPKCGKPDISQPIEVDDRPDHTLMVMKMVCTYTAPVTIAGLKATSYTSFEATEVIGATFQDRGYVVIKMENGDKVYATTRDTGSMKDEKNYTDEGTYSVTGGTGKLKGIKGKGIYKGAGATDGDEEVESEGEYSLPEASARTKEK